MLFYFMKRISHIFSILVTGITILSCKESSMKTDEIVPISQSGFTTFNKDIKPMFVLKCSPCHAEGGDRVNKYVEYSTAKTLITGIIGRITKENTDPAFMPKNGVKINPTEMKLINKWIDDGLLEK